MNPCHSVVPDFKVVTPEHVRDHLQTCPDCRGPFSTWCSEGVRLFNRLAEDSKRESDVEPRRQAWELIRSGWKFEIPRPDSDAMSWYWRSPPKRKGSNGKFHASTNQAWRAMKRAAGEDPDE